MEEADDARPLDMDSYYNSVADPDKNAGLFTRATGKFKDYTISQEGLSMTDM